MRDIKDLCARIEDELSKIADSGLTTGNLENAVLGQESGILQYCP